jgi:predicted branched-subunit amino acid permease
MVLGVLPLGLAIGATLATSSVPALAGWLAGPAIFGGAAQLLTIQLIDAGSAAVVIVLSAILVNARVLVYGAAIAPWFAEASLRTRLLVAVPLIDPLFLLAQPRFQRGDLDQRSRTAYYTGAALTLLGAWIAVQAAALLVGGVVPQALQLSMAAPLVFAGYLAHLTRTRPAVVAAGTAAVVAVAGSGLPFQSALSVGVLAGLTAGWVAGRPSSAKESS